MGSALERLRAIDTTETDKKRTASVQARLAAARTEATAKRTVAASGGILDRVTSDVKKTTSQKKTTTKPTKVKSEQKSASTLGDALKRSWDVAAEYANTGTLNKKKIQEAAESKLDLGGATKSLLKGAAKSTGASVTNAATTLLKGLDTGTVQGKSREELVTTQKPETVERVQKAADRLAVSADKDIAIARETLGDLVTDVGVGIVQLGGDVAAGMIVPGGALVSMAARAFGGKAQQVRQKGGSIDAQVAAGTTAAVTEFLLEKLFSVGKFQTKYFGSGAVDDILEGVVSAVEDLGKTESGKAWLNHLATGGVNFLTEGVEEGLSGMLEPVADRIIGKLDGYEDKRLDWKEIGKEAGHAFLVGGIVGALGGTIGGTDTGKGRNGNATVENVTTGADNATPEGENTTTGVDFDNKPADERNTKVNDTGTRTAGRVAADPEQFRTEYAKRFPEATEEQIQERFEQFKGYAAGQDVVETKNGPMTRAEIKEHLAGLRDEAEIDRVVDGLLDEQERQSAAQVDEDLPWTWGEDSTRGEPRQTAETATAKPLEGGSPAQMSGGIHQPQNGAQVAESALANENTEPYTESEVTTNGSEEVHLRNSGQRDGSADPGGQVPGLEEGTGRAEGWNTEGRSADREAASLTHDEEKVSARSLGITGGTEDANVYIVTGGETESTRAAQQLADERGLELVLFTGGNLDIKKGGVVASARAYIEGNKVYVRADHPLYTSDQLMRHETGHDMIAKGEVNPNEVRKRIRETFGGEKIDQLSRDYAEAYEGARMTPVEIWEEVICDSLADMNIFTEQESVRMAEEVLTETKKASTEMEAEQSRGPPVGKMSFEGVKSYNAEVVPFREQIDSILDGKATAETSHLNMGKTPDLYSRFGFDVSLPLLVTAKHIKSMNAKVKTGNENVHSLSRGQIASLPKKLSSPVAVMVSKTDPSCVVVVTDTLNAKKEPVVVALKPDGTGNYMNVEVDANVVLSGYGKTNFDRYLMSAFTDGRMLLCDYGKSRQLQQTPGVQFPNNLPRGDFKDNVARFAQHVKSNRAAKQGNASQEPTKRKRTTGQKDMVREIQTGVRKEVAEQRRVTELKHKIRRHSEQMSGELLRPTDKRHIPEELRGPVALLLEAVNLESGYDLEYGRDAKYHRVERGTPGAEKTKRTQAFLDLKTAYGKLKEELVLDPDLLGSGGNGLLDEAMALGEKPVDAMNSQELTTIWKTVRAVEASVRTANQMFAKAKFATIKEAAEAVRKDNGWKNPRTELNYIGGLQRLTGLDMMTPETFFHQMGDSGEALFRMMRDAQDEHVRIMKAVADFTHETLGEIDVPALEKKLHTVTLGGEEVTLSTAQIMELHVLMRREQAHEHILAGGILPKSLPGRGLKKISRPEPVRGITVDELTAAIGVLSEEEAALAEKLQRYASNQLSDYGNRASMEVYNYRKFEEKNYWPIRSNRQEIRSTTEQDTQVTGVANRGFTKTTKPNANTSVVVGSIFDTFANHAAEMATYSAWLGATEDINRIRNYVFRDSEGNRTGTVKGLINRVHGERGADYLQKLLADVANGVKGAHGESDYMGALTGNYKAASVGANLRVIIQQPTALLRALDMIGPQHFVGTGNPLTGWERAKKYAPIAQWKDWGYFDINTGRQMKDVLFDSDSKLNRVKNVAMAPAGAMDSLSWGLLWNAVESETKHKNKELKPGTEEFYKTVAERFTEIVDHTQVVDGILQRSQIMRSSNGLTKMATSFMGEPTKQYNMMMAAVYDLSHADGKTKEAAKKRLARTAFALCVSAVVNSAAQATIDAVRDDDREKEYWEKWLAAYTGLTGDEKSTGEKIKNAVLEGNLGNSFNPAGYIPYLKDALSLIQGYDVSRMDMESIEKTVTASQNMMKALGGEGKYSLAGAGANLTAEVARLFGIPAANLKREVESFASLFAVETDNYLMQYRMEKAMLNPTYSGNAKTFYDILYHASKNDPEAHEIIYSDMLKLGYDEKRIKNAMETRMKVEQNVGSVDELSSRYLSPEQIAEYATLGISVDTFAMAYGATRDLEAIKDEEGDAVPNSLGLQIMAAVYSIPGLTVEQYKKLAGDLGAGKTVLGYSEKMVKSKLTAMEKKYG